MNNRILKWYGKVENGRLDLFAREAFAKYIRTSLDGREIELTIRPREKETTWPQYKYLYGHLLPLLADYMGEDIEAAAYIIKDRWNSVKKKILNPETGEEMEVKIQLSFARGNITRKHFGEIIDKVDLLLSSLGIHHSDIDNWQNESPEISED